MAALFVSARSIENKNATYASRSFFNFFKLTVTRVIYVGTPVVVRALCAVVAQKLCVVYVVLLRRGLGMIIKKRNEHCPSPRRTTRLYTGRYRFGRIVRTRFNCDRRPRAFATW